MTPRGSDLTVASYKGLGVLYRWALGAPLQKLGFVLAAPLTALLLGLGHISLWLKLGSADDCLGYTVQARRGL